MHVKQFLLLARHRISVVGNALDYSPECKINERVIEQLSTGAYIDKARNVVIVGACGTGKTYIANALASDACRKLHKTMYCRMFELISDIKHMEILFKRA